MVKLSRVDINLRLAFFVATILGLSQFGSAHLCQAAELPPPDKLAAIIDNSKVLEPGYKVAVAVNGNEAIVSTYRNKQSQRDDKDCKIDAALIARELMMSNDFGLRRVRVQFHDQSLTGDMREVNVSFAELKAFATGVVTKDEFVSSLIIESKPEPLNKNQTSQVSADKSADEKRDAEKKSDEKAGTGDTTKAATDSITKVADTSGESPNEKKPAASKIAAAVARKVPFASPQHPGVSFDIPDKWRVEASSRDLVFRLKSDATGQDNISLSVQRGVSGPLEAALTERKRWSYKGPVIERYNATKFGKGQYPGVLIIVNYPNWEDGGKQYYEMNLYFGKPGATYALRGWASQTKYHQVYPAFTEIMTNISLPRTAAAPIGARTAK